MITDLNTDFSFTEIVPDLAPLVIVDVGAFPMGNYPEIYAPLIHNNKALLYAFEADDEGCAKLAARLGPPHVVFPVVVGDGNDATFHHNAAAMTNSLLPPNMELASTLHGLTDYMTPVKSEAVKTHRLDDLIEAQTIDFLKMDVQGGELSVLQGGSRTASSAMVVQTEVEFVPLYQNQPLFADIDTYVRGLGFQFHTFINTNTRLYRPLQGEKNGVNGLNQMLWADAVYTPDVTQLDQFSDERLLKLVVILNDFYKSVDLALHVLTYVRDRGVQKPFHDYCARLGLG